MNSLVARPANAVEHIRRMRGGAQSQLMRCSDGEFYVVKFQNNPQGRRILANEIFATALAKHIGLPVATARIINVTEDLIRCSDEMFIEMRYGRAPLRSGLCFGSLYERDGNTPNGQIVLRTYDCLPRDQLGCVENISDFPGMLVFDKWTGNADSRQVVFIPTKDSYRAQMIDQGFCFGGTHWSFLDCPSHGFYFPPVAYSSIRGFEAFEPWLDRLNREIDATVLNETACDIPPEWYDGDASSLSELIDTLDQRRSTVAIEIWKARQKFPHLFPNWIPRSVTSMHQPSLQCAPTPLCS